MDGYINLTVTGGMPPYQIWWEDNGMETSASRYGLYAGDYHARVTDMHGDSAHIYISLLAPSNQITVQLSANTWGGCNGGSLGGNVNAMVNGGTPPYTYQWNGPYGMLPDTWQNISVWQQGTYYLTVTDANYNTAQASINVYPPPSVNVWVEAMQQYGNAHTACNNADGKIRIHLQGGQPPYNINVSGNSYNNNGNNNTAMATSGYNMYFSTSDTLVELDSLEAGWYNINANDMSGCGNGNGVELRQAEPPRVSVSGTVYENGYYFSCDTCHDAQMTAIVTPPLGGQGGSYYWFEIPDEYAFLKIQGASLFMNENKDFNMNDLPPAVSTSQTATIANAETLHGLIVADDLGCAGFTNFTLDKPKPVQAWGLRGNVTDSTFYIGSVNDDGVRIATNDTVRVVIAADGKVGIKKDLKIGGSVTSDTTLYIGTENDGEIRIGTNDTTRIVVGTDGDVKILSRLRITNLTAEINPCIGILAVDEDGTIGVANMDEPLEVADPCSNNNNGPPYFPNTWALSGNIIGNAPFIGTKNGQDFRIKTDNIQRMVIDRNGNVGIGTTSPESKLHIGGTIKVDGITEDFTTAHWHTALETPNGYAWRTTTANSSTNWQYLGFGMTTNGWYWMSTNSLDANATVKYPLRLELDDCGRAKLSMLPEGAWCDFVFDENYKRTSFEEQELFYKQNKRLMKIASAKEIEEKGLDIAGTLEGLTFNVEETRLDMIELYTRLVNLEKENEQLKSHVKRLLQNR